MSKCGASRDIKEKVLEGSLVVGSVGLCFQLQSAIATNLKGMDSGSKSESCPWGKTSNSTPISPWAEHSTQPPCSLEDVMSEQLALDVEHAQLGGDQVVAVQQQLFDHYKQISSDRAAASGTYQSDAELAAKFAQAKIIVDPNDEAIARYLQREFDKEYDAMVDQVEKKYNGTSKVSISFENYKMKHQRQEAGFDIDEDDDDDNGPELPEFPTVTSWESNQVPKIGLKGYAGQGKNIITKHDKVICGRRNAERLMEFPPEFESGDGEGMDMQLPNKVYNRLKAHSNHESRRGQKVHEKKEHSTAIKAVDQKTRIILFKLINSGFLTGIDGVVSEGKEAVIFKSTGGMKDEKPLPSHVILKIFKTTMNEFRIRAKYVQGDHRLSKDIYKKQNPRKIMKLWAEKECMNLKRMRRQNIPCPTPITLKKHVLAMTCIGDEQPAPKLKVVKLSTEDMQDAYEQTVKLMKRLYHACGLVHADLSEYNMLWHDGKVWVIDVSQAVEKENPHSNDFLLRDCQNITKFFKQAGVYQVSSPEELFMDVTSCSFKGEGKVFAAEAQRYVKTDYAFDYYFEQDEDVLKGPCSDNSSESENEEAGGDENSLGLEETEEAKSCSTVFHEGSCGANQRNPKESCKTDVLSPLSLEEENKWDAEHDCPTKWEISCDVNVDDRP
ncbi:hypothetical protein RRG08_013766 [Elysia crispata]|uniref:non-specific serine/threonine protein kinase n=1 Tax=Elysia crispata TaxID=231223 RepID=A0AAE0ZPU7_9GAST|nr:hypothetical protein RRG08_013766 [Elysia crispata]